MSICVILSITLAHLAYIKLILTFRQIKPLQARSDWHVVMQLLCVALVSRGSGSECIKTLAYTNPHKQNHTDSYQDYVDTHKRIVILCVIVNHFLRNSKQLLGWHCWQQSAVRNKALSYFLRIYVNRQCKWCRQYFQFFLKLIKQQEN